VAIDLVRKAQPVFEERVQVGGHHRLARQESQAWALQVFGQVPLERQVPTLRQRGFASRCRMLGSVPFYLLPSLEWLLGYCKQSS